MEQKDRDEYLISHSSVEDPLLAQLNRQTFLKMINPKMISGHYQGKFLEMLSFMLRPRQILEIGTFTGYSAICLARGLSEHGKLHTIDKNDEVRAFASAWITRAGLEKKIVLHTGDALDIIPSLPGPFDLVFIDGEKTEYKEYYLLSLPRVRKGGYLLADNVLWNGKVYRPEFRNDQSTKMMIAFNKMITEDERVENIMVPVRDGLMIMRKK